MKKYLIKSGELSPRINFINWLTGTFLYTVVLLINQNFELIHAIGFTPKAESIIKLTGVLGYMLFTASNLKQTQGNDHCRSKKGNYHSKYRRPIQGK